MKKLKKKSNEPELLIDYEIAQVDMANIQLEVIELQKAIKLLNDFSYSN